MRDPIEDLQHFRSEGTTVNPLPASEVRRRGDRMRRRNTALATVGGVAAVLAAVAVPVSVLQSGADDQGRDISPAPPAATWLQEVPAEFPLADGLRGGPVGDDGVRDLEQCAADTWHLERSVARADASTGDGVEGFAGRTLAVYADADAAGAALDQVEATVSACAEKLSGPLRYSVGPEDTGGTEAETLLVVEQAELEEGSFSDLTFTRLSRDGNAVLIDQAYTSAGGASALNEVSRNLLERSAVTRSALCVFDAQPCDLATVLGEEPGSSAAQVVPDDFPLLDGFPEASAGESARTGPSREVPPLVPEACGARAEVPAHTDLVRAGFGGHADTRERQLVTFGSEGEAENYLESVLSVFSDCLEATESGRRSLTFTVTDVSGVGDRTGGAVTRYEVDGEPVPGVSTVVVVRVGSAVLVSTRETESAGTDPAADVQEEFNAVLDDARGVVEAMQDL